MSVCISNLDFYFLFLFYILYNTCTPLYIIISVLCLKNYFIHMHMLFKIQYKLKYKITMDKSNCFCTKPPFDIDFVINNVAEISPVCRNLVLLWVHLPSIYRIIKTELYIFRIVYEETRDKKKKKKSLFIRQSLIVNKLNFL